MNIREIQENREELLDVLLALWERSVKATHSFLTVEDMEAIKPCVPAALRSVPVLCVAEDEEQTAAAFFGIDGTGIEMLFAAPEVRGKGLGKQCLQTAISVYGAQEVTVNEQNLQAVGFYEHMGFVPYKRTDRDEQGRPYPLLYMKLKTCRKSSRLPEDSPSYGG